MYTNIHPKLYTSNVSLLLVLGFEAMNTAATCQLDFLKNERTTGGNTKLEYSTFLPNPAQLTTAFKSW